MSTPANRPARRKRKINYQTLSGEGPISLLTKEALSRNGIDANTSEIVSRMHPHVAKLLEIPVEKETSESVRFLKDGSLLTSKALRADTGTDNDNGIRIDKPIIISDNCSSLGMKMPKKLSVRDVSRMLGHAYPVTCMDISTQEETDMIRSLEDLAEYFEIDDRSNLPIINQISLEFSGTPLANLAKSPLFVREIDWIDNVWPNKRKKSGDYPRKFYYCIELTNYSFALDTLF